MTSTALHPVPSHRVVLLEQLRSAWLAMRWEAAGLLVLVLLFLALAIYGALQAAGNPQSSMNMEIEPGFTIPAGILGLLIPFILWRGEEPSRRSYHLAMPVSQPTHTLLRVAGGWVWTMLAVVGYLLFVLTLGLIAKTIAGSTFELGPVWQWAIPFTAATTAYLVTSTGAIGSNHPWRWFVGVFLVLLIGRPLFDAFELDSIDGLLETLRQGRYGMFAAMFGDIEVAGVPSTGRWLGATLIWAGGALAAVIALAHRRSADQ